MRFITTAFSYAGATAEYLFSYGYVILLAPVVAIALHRTIPIARLLETTRLGPLRFLLAGSCSSPTAGGLEGRLRQLPAAGRRGAVVAVVCGAHLVTVYHLFLLGPLLGKDALLSHLIASTIFGALACLIWYALDRIAPAAGAARGREARTTGAIEPGVWQEVRHVGLQMAVGLLVGGLIAVWGLSSARIELATIFGGGLDAQLLSAVLGTAVGSLATLPPVAALFVATYLWKTGIAQAGLASFLLASTVTPSRLRVYARVLGEEHTWRLAIALLLAGPAAGVATAILFRALGLTIHYRLIPEQML